MSEKRGCPECGTSLPPGVPEGPCPRCLMGAGDSATRTFPPEAKAPRGGPVVDFDGFRRAVLELGLVDPVMLEVIAARAAGEVKSLARLLVRAGKLTAYQAGALARGKAKGLVVGPCLVLEKRGQGGMGVVFRARHRRSGKVVALKILLPSFGRDRDAVARFRREFEVAARLDHPNVVRAMEADEDRGVQFLTMEYVEGHDLDDLVRSVGPLPIKMATHCAIQAARGLAAAHEAGIIHRDVKPGNLMLDAVGTVRVLDLGLARVIESANTLALVAGAGLTRSGAYMGTVDYMAPEQADDPKEANHPADIYGLGCTLHFLLAGRPPFGGKTILQRMMAHQNESAPSLHDVREDVPDLLEHVYQEMMSKRPADRPGSMAEVVARLEACRASADEAREARDGLMTFAGAIMKRASPRKPGRDPDASVFARRSDSSDLRLGADLDLEDLVMDYRDEAKVAPLTGEQLPPVLPRVASPGMRRKRVPAPGLLGVIGALAACLTAYVLIPGGDRDAGTSAPPTSTPKLTPVAVVSPGFQSLFNGKDLDGWSPIDGDTSRWRVEDGILVVEGGGMPFMGIVTDRSFREFRLRVEFQASSGADGGLYLLHALQPARGQFCEEFNIAGPDDLEATTGIAAYFDGRATRLIRKPRPVAMNAGDDWNSLELVVKDKRQTFTVNGRDVVYDEGLEAVESTRHRIGLQDLKGTLRFRKVEIQELTEGPATKPAAPRLASSPRTPRALFSDDFDPPPSYWSASTPEDLARDPNHRRGTFGGVYFHEVRGGSYAFDTPNGPYPDFSAEVVARITGDKVTSKGAVVLHVVSPGARVIQVRVDDTGAVFIAPSWAKRADWPDTPWIGPYFNPAIHRGGGAFNTIRLEVRGRRLDIFVNSTRALPPLEFDWDLTPASIYVGADCKAPVVQAQYDRIEIKELPDEPGGAREPTGDRERPLRVADRGGVVLPDGTWIFEGAQLAVTEVTGGKASPQENMDEFPGGRWTNHRQLLWEGARAGDTLTLRVPLDEPGNYEVQGRFTQSPGFGRCKLEIDGKPLAGGQLLNFNAAIVKTIDLPQLGFVSITSKTAFFKLTVVGRNRSSPAVEFGLDELRLIPVR